MGVPLLVLEGGDVSEPKCIGCGKTPARQTGDSLVARHKDPPGHGQLCLDTHVQGRSWLVGSSSIQVRSMLEMSDKDSEQLQLAPMGEDLAVDTKGGVEETVPENKNGEGDAPLDSPSQAGAKKVVPGIIYLGHIPPRFRPPHVRKLLSIHGEVGRIFFQPEEKFVRKKKKKAGINAKNFTEGWVEFRDKHLAKLVAASLHNTPMSTRKKSRFRYDLWNMKYLHRFKWTHLSERLAYERQVQQQRMRAEVSQAKRETNFYLQNVEKSKQFSKKSSQGKQEDKSWSFVQRRTEDEIQTSKANKRLKQQLARAAEIQQKSQSNRSLLAKIFNAQP